ncbi:hypothetical protein PQX77_009765 [Marasmius sp. AFHP31]|nr:hypothetical protein PQX77_009765 [Marasmius sp. AFHP31]
MAAGHATDASTTSTTGTTSSSAVNPFGAAMQTNDGQPIVLGPRGICNFSGCPGFEGFALSETDTCRRRTCRYAWSGHNPIIAQTSDTVAEDNTVTPWVLSNSTAPATGSTNDRRLAASQRHNHAHSHALVDPVMASGITSSAVASNTEAQTRSRRSRRRAALAAPPSSTTRRSSARTSSSTMTRLQGFNGASSRRIVLRLMLVPLGVRNVQPPMVDYIPPANVRLPELKRPTFATRGRSHGLEKTIIFTSTDPPEVVHNQVCDAVDSVKMEMVPSPDPAYTGQLWTLLKAGNRARGENPTRLFHPCEEARYPQWWTLDNIKAISNKDQTGVEPADNDEPHDFYLFFAPRFGLGKINGHPCIAMKLLNGTADSEPGVQDIPDNVHLLACPRPIETSTPALSTTSTLVNEDSDVSNAAVAGSGSGSPQSISPPTSVSSTDRANALTTMPMLPMLRSPPTILTNRRPRSDSLEVEAMLGAPPSNRLRLDDSDQGLLTGIADPMEVIEDTAIPPTDPLLGLLAPRPHSSDPPASRITRPLPRRIPRRGAVENLLNAPMETIVGDFSRITPPPEARTVRFTAPTVTPFVSPDSSRPPTPTPRSPDMIYMPTSYDDLNNILSNDVFRTLPDRTFKFIAAADVGLDDIATSLLDFLKYRVRGEPVNELHLRPGVEVIGSGMSWDFLLSQNHVEFHWGLGQGYGITKTVVNRMWDIIFDGDDHGMWANATESFRTLSLAGPVSRHTLLMAQVFGVATTLTICLTEQLPRGLSPALIQAVHGGHKSIVSDLIFLREVSPDLANVIINVWPNASVPPDLRIREDQTNKPLVDTLIYMLEELDIEADTLDGLLPDELEPLRERLILHRLLGSSRASSEFKENPLIKRFALGMDIAMNARSADSQGFLEILGRVSKTLIASLTPTLIFKPEAVIRNITWKSSVESRPQDLQEDEQNFRAIFESWISQPGHVSHPNLLERIAASEVLHDEYTVKFVRPSDDNPRAGCYFHAHTCMATVDVIMGETMKDLVHRSLIHPIYEASPLELALHDFFCALEDAGSFDVYNAI